MEPVDSAGITMLSTFAGHDLAIGLEYVRRKDLEAAKRSLATLRNRSAGKQRTESNTDVVSRYSTVSQSDLDTTAVMEQVLDAAIRYASGEREAAIAKILAAAEAEDRLVFEYGPPAIPKPAWEAAGEMLLEAGRKNEAADAFRRALKRYPNRRLSNEGLRNALGK